MELGFSDLTVALGGRRVLDGISGQFRPARITVVLGPNGAGKSTLLACLAGLRQPDGGRVVLGADPVLALDRRRRARLIGLLPQRGEINWNIDATELVALGRLPHRGRWGATAEDRRAVAEAMAETDTAGFAGRRVRELSGGEQARVLLARVLAGEPRWLLADEPLANLDPAYQLDVLERLIRHAATGAGVVVVLHDLTQAARIADDVLLLKDGAVVAQGPRADVLTAPRMTSAYGVEVHIAEGPDGKPLLVPVRRTG